VATKFGSFIRRRRALLVIVSAVMSLVAAKHGGIQSFGFWDGPV
jgi:hypothetical protein